MNQPVPLKAGYKFRRFVLVMIVSLVALDAHTLVFDVPVDEVAYSWQSVRGFTRLNVTRAFCPFQPGEPELPVMSYRYFLPGADEVVAVRILEERWEEVEVPAIIYPSQQHSPIDEHSSFTEPTAAVYSVTTCFPESTIIDWNTHHFRSCLIVDLAIALFKVRPQVHTLYRLSHLVIGIETVPAPMPSALSRQTPRAHDLTKRLLCAIVENEHMVIEKLQDPHWCIEKSGEEAPSEYPSRSGAPVDIVIITTPEQSSAYEDYAKFKRMCGYNTVVRTLPWIRQHYSGIDDAERIRNFIRDAYLNWGIIFVILGGDESYIPTRYVWMSPLYTQWSEQIATDLYYSDLDGTWNADGDALFGEVADSLDLYPDVFVGRLSTCDPFAIDVYLNKTYDYLYPQNTSSIEKVLFFSSDFEVNGDAYQMAMRLSEHLPSLFQKSFLDEEPRSLVRDSIESGFGMVMGLGHGDINNIRIRNSPRESATNYFFDSLTYEGLYGLMCVITCYTNTFQSDCVGEHWLFNPCGGGIGYIGPTSFSEAYLHEEYMSALFDSLFMFPLGMVLGISKIPYVLSAQGDNWYRLYQFSITLLGDPSLTLWSTIPQYFTSVTAIPETLNIGVDTLHIMVEPLVPCVIAMFKEDELFMRDSVSGGQLTAVVETESAGYVKYAVISEGYGVYVDSVVVVPGAAYCACGGYWVVDTVSGNGNGLLEPGEEAVVYVVVVNQGGVVASGVRGQLVSGDSVCAVVVDTAWYGDLGSGMSGVNVTGYEVVVGDWLVDGQAWVMWLVMSYGGSVSVDSFAVQGVAPELVHFGQWYAVCAETVKVWPWVENQGHSGVDTVQGVIAAVLDSVVVVDSVVVFVDVGVGAVRGAVDSFVVVRGSGSMVAYEYQLVREGQVVGTWSVYLDSVARVDSVRALGRRETVVVEWEPVPGVCGYRVYRGVVGSGLTYVGNLLQPMSYYEDYLVQPGVEYQYCVVAVDQSMNHSPASDTVIGMLNPSVAPGWPQPVYDFLFSSPNFSDLDPWYPGLEIVVCDKNGAVYAWHYDGTPVVNESRIFDISPTEVWSSPALGDVNNDGTIEILFGVRRATDNLYVINNQGNPLPNWPRSVSGRLIGSPVLADLDEDGDLEICVWTLYADLYVFHHDGSGVYSSDGLLANLPGVAFGAPAVGDIDCDGELEIICCGGSSDDSLYVWDRYGNLEPPFPIFIQPGHLGYSVVCGDIIGNERLEICFYADSTEKVYVVSSDGSIIWSAVLPDVADIEGSPVLGDITGDGHPEVICGNKRGITVFDSLGTVLQGFPDLSHDAKLAAVADINHDGLHEVIVGSNNWHLYGYTQSGNQTAGFPVCSGNRIDASPAVFDIDDDGNLELMLGGNDFTFTVLKVKGQQAEWPRYRYDCYNTGVYGSQFLPGVMDRGVKENVCADYIGISPNPFVDLAVIHANFAVQPVPHAGNSTDNIALKIYDVAGRVVKELPFSTEYHKGSVCLHAVWTGDDQHERNVSAGVYFVRLEIEHTNYIEKVVKIK